MGQGNSRRLTQSMSSVLAVMQLYISNYNAKQTNFQSQFINIHSSVTVMVHLFLNFMSPRDFLLSDLDAEVTLRVVRIIKYH